MITVQEMLRQMETTDERGRPQPFSVLVCTCNEALKTGGKLLPLENVVLSRLAQDPAELRTPTVKRRKAPAAPRTTRDTQTRNLYNPATADTITVNNRLILRFNGQIVID